ncbi:ABC transporter substrate-binding protein [Ruminococcus sp.]|uniref:ABC transporter substrate-binding protein n=1 Tax=Ruminococcus sp. TaxID=41978 RepID=UPI0025E8C079|nr:ABC transporter substrate-binding protein [Ruminococcus sp.]MBQ8967456.1 ABC transporter substrate-binding protein [Ruminococcus sp.]
MKRFISAALCALMILGLTSCEQQTDEAPQVEPAPPFSVLDDVIEGRRDIYVIVKNLESSYWQVIIEGARDSSDKYGCNVYCSGSYSETDWESQSRLLDEAVAAGADAIILAPDDSVKLSDKIDEVYATGTKVVLIDTAANTENYDICFMTDNLMAGQQAAAEMIRQLYAKGHDDSEKLKVGIQVGSPSSQTISERIAGFLQYWKNNAPPNWEVIHDIKCNYGDLDKASECATELLEGYPDICGVFGTNNGSAVGFAKEVRAAGRTDVVVVGFDYSPEMAELISSEKYTASTVLQRQYDMTNRGIGTALELLDGADIENKFIDTGIVVVSRETLDDPDVKEILSHN